MDIKYNDLTALKFGRLTPVEIFREKNKPLKWKCVCDCGKEKIISATKLVSGWTKSCGCLRLELTRQLKYINIKHNRYNTKEYYAYHAIKDRCYNSKNKHFKHYGGRGIGMCETWQNSFQNFFSDMGLAPSPKHSIDREDVNGNYESLNCRWVTPIIQSNNRRNVHQITYNGESHSLNGWSKLLGMSSSWLYEIKKRQGTINISELISIKKIILAD